MLDSFASGLNETFIGIYDTLVRLEEQLLSQSGQPLSISELHIIETIWLNRNKGCSISDIALIHQVTLPSMTIAVKKLENKGYVIKKRSETDGRVVYTELTRMGEKANSMHKYFHERMVRAFLRDIPEADKPVLLDALKNMESFIKRQLEIAAQNQLKG